jgi:outer membrane protein
MKLLNKGKILTTLVLLTVFGTSFTFAQQKITNFGIVDTAKVYEQFFRNSTAVRNYDLKKEEFQNEINKRTEELRSLKQKQIEYEQNDQKSLAETTAKEIERKTKLLKDYTSAKNIELTNLKNSLSANDTFYKKLSRVIKKVAENEGLSMVLSLQGEESILWYSPAVDITDKVIAELEK